MLLLRSMQDPEVRKLVEVSAGPLMDHDRVVEALKARHENRRLIYRRALDSLIDPSRTTSFSFDGLSFLRQFLADTNIVMEQCNGYLVEQVVSAIAIQTFDAKLGEKWRDWTTSLDSPPMMDFLHKFLENQLTSIGSTRETSDFEIKSHHQQHHPKSKKQVHKITSPLASNNCPVCLTSSHPLFRCNNFREWAVGTITSKSTSDASTVSSKDIASLTAPASRPADSVTDVIIPCCTRLPDPVLQPLLPTPLQLQ